MSTFTIVALSAVGAANLGAWAVYRLDKRSARLKRRRTPERALLGWAAFGPFGALVAMYGHRERHKVAKYAFAVGVPAFAVVHAAITLALLLFAIGALK